MCLKFPYARGISNCIFRLVFVQSPCSSPFLCPHSMACPQYGQYIVFKPLISRGTVILQVGQNVIVCPATFPSLTGFRVLLPSDNMISENTSNSLRSITHVQPCFSRSIRSYSFATRLTKSMASFGVILLPPYTPATKAASTLQGSRLATHSRRVIQCGLMIFMLTLPTVRPWLGQPPERFCFSVSTGLFCFRRHTTWSYSFFCLCMSTHTLPAHMVQYRLRVKPVDF